MVDAETLGHRGVFVRHRLQGTVNVPLVFGLPILFGPIHIAFLEMVIDAGNPIALSSDAHTPEQLGFEYERALEYLDRLMAVR